MVEITERAVAARPAELLWTAGWIREQGWAIALDDVGAEKASLALMPFLRPEIIKLDLSLIHREPSREGVRTISGVLAEAESTGARIIAEGIETLEHLDRALALGATLGQGWLFGRPWPATSCLPTSPASARPETQGGSCLRRYSRRTRLPGPHTAPGGEAASARGLSTPRRMGDGGT